MLAVALSTQFSAVQHPELRRRIFGATFYERTSEQQQSR
jgi:hypothetical protein